MARSVETGGPRKGKPMVTKRLGGEVTIVPAGVAKEILKKAITTTLAKRAANAVDKEKEAKIIVEKLLKDRNVQAAAKPKDMAKQLYNYYKKNPVYDKQIVVKKVAPPKTKEQLKQIAMEKAIAASKAKKARIEAGISVKKAKPNVSNKGSVTEKGKAAAIARNAETKRQAAVDAQNASTKQGQTIRGKFYEEPRPGYGGREIPGKSINVREPKVNPEKPPTNELGAFTKLTDAEKKIFMQSDRDAIQAVINARKGIKDLKPKKPETAAAINKRLFEASKKLTPDQLKKIKAIVAETQRRARG